MSSKNSRTSSPAQHAPSKLPKFLQKQSTRDRSKSVTDPGIGRSPSPEVHSTPLPGKRSSPDVDEPPVIVEPARHYPSSRVGGDLPTRLSGWFSHTFSSSSNDLSLPSLLATHTSPKSKGSALLTAAKHGKGHLDKAVRYLLDSDSTPDRCTDPIWLLGVQHPGYEPGNSVSPSPSRRGSASPTSFRSSTSSVGSLTSEQSQKLNPGVNWPPVFYIDFTSRVWLTYRSQFPLPIKDGRFADLCTGSQDALSTSSVKKSAWNWGGEKTWSSDSGWGCMLRTGQSLLANALIHVHLGRDWRKPPYPVLTADYASYVHILSWFLDTPVPEAPFSVHRMALAGKEFGTDVGQWFGPSVAAGAIKTLVNAYPDAGIGVAIAVDGMVCQTDVHAASHGDHFGRSPRRHTKSWGDRPVLVLVGVRLGIEGVNPIYYNSIKALYTFPQSVGIAGGRPKSSYYFVGSQADNLFYLDPHHARPAIPLRPPPPGPSPIQSQQSSSEDDRSNKPPKGQNHRRLPTSPSSSRTSATASSTFSYHAPTSPSPLQQQYSTDSEASSSGSKPRSPPPVTPPSHGRWRSASQPPASPSDLRVGSGSSSNSVSGSANGLDPVQLHYCTAYSGAELSTFHCDRVRKMPLSGLDPSMLIGFLCRSEEEWIDLRKRISELPRTILTIQDEPPSWPDDSEYDMGLESVSEPDDIDIDDEDDALSGLEKRREEGEDDGDEDDEEDDDDDSGDQFFDTRSMSASLSSGSRRRRDDNDTEEDVNDPVTPGPMSRFDVGEYRKGEEDDIEDDWVEPSLPTPMPDDDRFTMVTKPSASPSSSSSDASASTPASTPASSSLGAKTPPSAPRVAKTKSRDGVSKKRKGKKQVPVPVPVAKEAEHYPFPVTRPDEEDRIGNDEDDVSYDGLQEEGKMRRMHTARARDGGRTQSGGVKGILADDLA
ncbi:cysteine protease [Ephemerocybe angulata]|uniref:Cysteine protease n=1 Tax=Ephemerocybe angulata TaxID=980116 RepID=A0A8H6HRY6_9AGAR|nr:cysteine protease [Tulosesus angulatus]